MEASAVRTDYYHGRPFVEITEGSEDWDWAIHLADGAVIRNTDKRRTHIPEIDGLEGSSLLMTTLSEHGTVLKFGVSKPTGVEVRAEITLTPGNYTVSDPHYTKGEEITPQTIDDLEAEHVALGFAHGAARKRHADALPPDPSDERTRTDEQVEADAESRANGTSDDEAGQ